MPRVGTVGITKVLSTCAATSVPTATTPNAAGPTTMAQGYAIPATAIAPTPFPKKTLPLLLQERCLRK